MRRLLRAAASRYVPGGSCQCALCERHQRAFLPYHGGEASRSPLTRALGTVGSNVDAFECVWCGASDRERHLWIYLNQAELLATFKGARVLHFAPERRLTEKLMALGASDYIRADLYPGSPDIQKVDMLNTGFEDNSFDIVIANHVLEHVDDDIAAARELCRILRPGGKALLQTPYTPRLHHTWSDPGIDSDDLRFLAHGQNDHVRLFGRDIFERFEQGGLVSQIRHHRELALDYDPKHYGINPDEPLFLFSKP